MIVKLKSHTTKNELYSAMSKRFINFHKKNLLLYKKKLNLTDY